MLKLFLIKEIKTNKLSQIIINRALKIINNKVKAKISPLTSNRPNF